MKKISVIMIASMFLITGLSAVMTMPNGNACGDFDCGGCNPHPMQRCFRVAFEDLKIAGNNDWDYNDWVAQFDVEVDASELCNIWYPKEITITITPKEHMAQYDHEFWLKFAPFWMVKWEIEYADDTTTDGCLYENDGKINIYESTEDAMENGNVAVLTLSWDDDCHPFTFSYDSWESFGWRISKEYLYANCHIGGYRLFQPYIVIKDTDPEYTVPEKLNGNNDVYGDFNQPCSPDARVLFVGCQWQWPDEGQPIWDVYDCVNYDERGVIDFNDCMGEFWGSG